jgi:membrane protease YdiL (CAAX protease family)
MSTLSKVVVGAVPVIGGLVAAAFVIPADFPLLPRQTILFAWAVGGIALAEYFLFERGAGRIATAMGLVAPRRRAVLVAMLVSLPMWLFLPLHGALAGIPVSLHPDWAAILLGVILVNGLAEEVIHRAFVFGRLRNEWSFMKAASVSAVVFALQHLYLVVTIGSVAGGAAILLALLLAFPLAFIYERGGRSLAGPAILHTSSNAPIMLLVSGGGTGPVLLPHMAVVLVSIYGVFAFSRWLRW